MILYCWWISDRLSVLFRSKHEEILHCLHLYDVHVASPLICWSFSWISEPIDTNQFIVVVMTICTCCFTQQLGFFFQFVSKQYKTLKTADLIFWKSVQYRLKDYKQLSCFIFRKLINSWSITPFYCVQNSSMTVHLYFIHIHPCSWCTLILITIASFL